MPIHFHASQSVELTVPEQSIPIEHYLKQPKRLVQALTDPSRIEYVAEGQFRLTMRSMSFMHLTLQPTVEMQVWSGAGGEIHLRSLSCQLRGIEYVNQRFSLNLVGNLIPHRRGNKTVLQGSADLQVSVDLPPPFSMMPRSLLETTGNGLLKSVLLTVKQRLVHQLLDDYRHWASREAAVQPASRSGVLVGQS